MSRRVVFGLLAAVLVLVAGWGFAQKPADEAKPAGPVGRYAVSPIGNTAVVLDTATGKAWVLAASAADSEPSAWLPTIRLDSEQDVAKWRDRQRAVADQRPGR